MNERTMPYSGVFRITPRVPSKRLEELVGAVLLCCRRDAFRRRPALERSSRGTPGRLAVLLSRLDQLGGEISEGRRNFLWMVR